MKTPTVKVGQDLISLLCDAYHGGVAVLLEGPHGVGKSEVLEQVAYLLEIKFLSRDLSMMQPVDLVGIPIIDGEVTRFARPAFLPGDGCGLIVFEELNRCPEYMRAPCLELLTRRVLNDYQLPKGWWLAACINPTGSDYHVEELCDALKSRFMQVRVEADSVEWAKWARLAGVHEKIVEFVEQCPGVFDDPDANPRAWTYASKLLKIWERSDTTSDRIRTGVAAVVGETWAIPFLQFYTNGLMPLTAVQTVDQYVAFRPMVLRWLEAGRLDMLLASVELLKSHLLSESSYKDVLAHPEKTANIRSFLSDLPADFKKTMRSWLSENRREKLSIPRKRAA